MEDDLNKRFEEVRAQREERRLVRDIESLTQDSVPRAKPRRKKIRAQRVYNVKRKYNLTKARLVELYQVQDYKCAVCGVRELDLPKGLHVDHDHASGEVRGLLCPSCNYLLAHAKDSVSTLTSAVAYLLHPPFTRT